MQKAKWLSEEALQIAEKKRESENEDAVMSKTPNLPLPTWFVLI